MSDFRFLPAAGAALALLAVLAVPASADLGGFLIERFDTELTVLDNADLLVEERIVVRFEEPRRGIYRDIPVRYTDPIGYRYSLGFRLLEVVDDNGAPHPVKESSSGAYRKIRIGDPDVQRTGRVTYVIRYRVRDALGHFEDHDEVYWNATGNEWRVPILEASATVRLPAPVEAGDLEAAGYTGPFRSKDQDADVSIPEPGVVRYTARSPLDPFEGLTVVAAFPTGHVEFPGAFAVGLRRLLDNFVLVVPLAALVGLFRRYRSQGRDPEGPAAVVVRYEPPPNLTPGELGTLMDETVDMRDVTATVVDLAVRGRLRIRMEEAGGILGFGRREEPVFEKLEEANGPLHPHERLVLDALFETGDEVPLKKLRNKFYRKLPGIKKALFARLTEIGHFAEKPPSVRARYVGAGFGFAFLTAAAGAAWAWFRGGILPNALVVPLAAGVAVLLLFLAFSAAMPRRTRSGVALRNWGLGFEEFVDRVETETLERQRARNVFETLLPFAMALGVAEKWSERFEGLYASGGPAWFLGVDPAGSLSTASLHDGLSSAMESTARSMASAPRSSGSSGSGGGGFSGGGGGGGGGGSW